MSQSAETTQTFELTDKQREIRSLFSLAARYFLVYGGSRSGKTFFIVYAIITRALKAPGSRHVIFRRHSVAVKQSIGKDTFKKVMELAYPQVTVKWHEQDSYFTFPNGAEVWLAGLDDKDRVDKVLGKEYATLYFNEASEIPLASFSVALTRLAQRVKQVDGRWLPHKCYVDLNPTTSSHWTYRMWVDGVNPDGEVKLDKENYKFIVVNPLDNMNNLDPDYIKSLRELPERQRQRFFYGEFTGDLEHALWRRSFIRRTQEVPDLKRIVVAIDPAVSNEVGSDETGIIVAGIDQDNLCYVLDDMSGKYRPEEWARRAISLYDVHNADRIVAEVNQGGAMVRHTIETQRKGIPFTEVHASRGKYIRAEPIAGLYEQGKVVHTGEFKELEDQMCFVAGTLIETQRGQIPIEEVTTNDRAMTRYGWMPVKVARKTREVYSVVDIETEDGRVLTCTETHPIFCRGKFVAAKSVQSGDRLLGSPNWGSTGHQLLGEESGITGCDLAISATPKAPFCIGPFGNRTSVTSQTGFTSITLTKIPETIGSITSRAFRMATIMPSISQRGGMLLANSAGRSGRLPLGVKGSGQQKHASTAGRNMKPRMMAGLNTALRSAALALGQGLRRLSGIANIAAPHSQQETPGESIAVKAVTMRPTAPVSVYNLSVDGHPEYFANGLLVHNCTFTSDFDRKLQGYSPDRVDALVWALTELFPKIIRKPVKHRRANQAKPRFF